MSSLNQEQLNAVLDNSEAMLVLAGAGSGKTRVLTEKIIYVLNNFDLTLDNILVVTFTNKAVNEIISRVSQYIQFDKSYIGTFHSICLRILMHANYLDRNFKIIDSNEQLTLLKQIISKFES